MNAFAKSPALPLLALIGMALTGPLHAGGTAPTPPASALTSLTGGPNGALPPGAKLRSVTISNGLATADFSRELRDDFHGGDTEEARAVNSVLQAMGRFPDVSRVQTLVDGKRISGRGTPRLPGRPARRFRPPAGHQTHRAAPLLPPPKSVKG